VAGAARLALLRPELLPTGRAGARYAPGRGRLLPRALLLLLIGGVLLSSFAVGPLIDRVGAATAERAQFFGITR
jgi:hypothetical protein